MPLSSSTEFKEFIQVYEELSDRYRHHENARAFLNEVAAELLATLSRKDAPPSESDPRRYFLWLLGAKGFYSKRYLWFDVDRPRHQCNRKPVEDMSLDELDAATDPRLAVDPRERLTNSIFADQALEVLEDDEQELLRQRLVDGHTLQEIADRERITPQGVKKRLDKTYARLREEVA